VGSSNFSALSAQVCLPVAFRRAAFASGSLPFPLRHSAFLTVSLLAISTTGQTSLGVPCSAGGRDEWGGCLLCCGSWVSVPVMDPPTGTITPFITGLAVPVTRRHAASSKVHLHSSFQSSPRPVASFGSKLPWTLPLAFHFTVPSDAERDWRQPWTLGWELALHSTQATSCRTHPVVSISEVLDPDEGRIIHVHRKGGSHRLNQGLKFLGFGLALRHQLLFLLRELLVEWISTFRLALFSLGSSSFHKLVKFV
jgi:hypothetical protein